MYLTADPFTDALRRPKLRTAERPTQPPPPLEDVADPATGEILATDTRTAVERTKALATQPMDDAILANALAHDVLPADLVDAELNARPSKKLTKKQKQIIKLAAEAMKYRQAGYGIPEIAEAMGVAPDTITGWFTRFRFALAEDAIDEMLDKTAVPLAAQNLVHGLLQGDKDYTLKTLEGRGHFKRHTDQGDRGDTTPPPLIVRIEGDHPVVQLGAPPPPTQVGQTKGFIVGAPDLKRIEGQVVPDGDDEASD